MKGADDDEMPELEELKQEVVQEEQVEEVKVTYPLQVVYCPISGIPPEYLEWAGKKVD